MSSRLLISIIALGALVGSIWLFLPMMESTDTHSNKKIISSEKPQGGNFTMMTPIGEKQLADYQGKLVLLYFGYTFCPDICPTNLGNLSVAYQELTAQQKDNLQILFISVDPERDTPERLQQYVNYFESNMVGMTNTADIISEVAHRYGVVYAKVDDPNNGTNYAVDHSAFTYVVDQNGVLKEQLPHATTATQFIDTINKYLK